MKTLFLRAHARAIAFVGSLVVLSIPLGASADEAATAPAPLPAEAQAGKVEVLVVTAEKRTENLQSAPVAASVLTEEALKDRSIHEVDDLEFATPSLTISSNGQSNMMNIRGIGKEDNSGNVTSAVAVYRDGVGTVSGFFNGEPYYDVASVEVLRGPQGTYVGENAAGGAIFVNTRDPEIGGAYSGFVEAGYGDWAEHDLQGALNIPIGDTFAARVAFDHVDRDSFYDAWQDAAKTTRTKGHLNDIDHDSGRVKLRWQPSDALDVKLSYDHNVLDNHGYAFTVVPGTPFLFPEGPTNISKNPFVVGNNSDDNYAKDKIQRAALDVHYTFGDGYVLRSVSGGQWITSYIRNDDDGSVTMDRRQHIRAQFKVYTQELTLLSPAENRFTWIAGTFFREETLDFPSFDGFVLTDATHYIPGVPVVELYFPWHTPRRTMAVYGQAAYQLTDTVKLEVGTRYSHFRVSEEGHLVVLPDILGLDLSDFASYDHASLTGKAALNWQATPNHYFYAFIATGNTTGGVNVVVGQPNYEDQTTTDTEIGWKGQLFDGHLLTQLGGFYESIDNYQATFTHPGVVAVTAYQNLGGSTTIYGSELSIQAVFGGLSVDIGTAWIHSELGSAVITDNITGEDIDTDGKNQPFTPHYTFHGGIQYTFNLPGSMTLTPRGDYAWIDEQTTTPVDAKCNNPAICPILGAELDRIESHQQVNLRLTLDAHTWSLAGFMTNATDERYIEAHGGPGYNAYVNPRRTGGIKLTYNFGGEHG